MRLPTRNVLRGVFRRVTAALGLTVLALTVLALTGCTGGDDPTEPSEGSPKTSPPPITSTDSYVFTDAAGIEARLKIEGEGALLTLTNDTGAELPEPGVFVLDARDGVRTDWHVLDASAVAEGETEWVVERPPEPGAKNIGLVVLLFGGEDYGAFVPPQPGDEA